MVNAQEIFKKCSPSMRLYICTNLHIKGALLNVLHNRINEPQVRGIPSDSADLYTFLQTSKNKIQKSQYIKAHQKSILLPTNSQNVDSTSLDISLIRFLIQTFNGIKNANKDWKEPGPNDQTLCAYVFRAAEFRNRICHDNDVHKLDETTFEKKWKELKEILQGLKYVEDIEPFKTEKLEFDKLECVILEEFVDYLQNYKAECLNEPSKDDYIQRRFYVNRNENDIASESDTSESDSSSESDVESISEDSDESNSSSESEYGESDIVIESDLENIIKENDCVAIYAAAGMGKSSTARRIKKEWCNQNILKDFVFLFFDSKKINKWLKIQSHAAPLCYSELGDYLKKNGRTEDDLSIYSCVKTSIKKLIILIDGVDEFPVSEITGNYVDELERKVSNNEKITGLETICAIYFGHLFPYSKIVLLGRIGEFESLKKVKVKKDAAIFNRKIKVLELLKFDNVNVKDFTCLKICMCDLPSQQTICTGTCKQIYDKIKTIKLCKNPTDLNALIELYKKNPNGNIRKITRTKLIIATLLNRLTNHIKQKNNFIFKTFREISKQNDFNKYLKCIRTLGKISLKSLLQGNVTVKVNEEQETDGIASFKYENQICIERSTLEELDLFYIRDLEYYFELEPHHTLNIEFLSACYLFSHTDEWNSILKLSGDRQLVIISFIAGLYADDYFVKDYVKNVLNTSSYSLEEFFSWLYNVEDVFESLPMGTSGIFYGLMENKKLSPSFYLLDSISHEVEIPPTFIPKTIVWYCDYFDDTFIFEWQEIKDLKHNVLTKSSDKFNIESFLKKFPSFKFIVRGIMEISNDYNFNRLNQFDTNNLITFEINELEIYTPLDTYFNSNFDLNKLRLWDMCDSRTIDIILNSISPPTTKTSSSNIPTLKCKRLDIENIGSFNSQQTETLLKLGLSEVFDCIQMWFAFFTYEQIYILENAERYFNKLINIELYIVKFNSMFSLPNLGNRHVSLYHVNNVTENDIINLRQHIPSGNSSNLCNYKIIDYYLPFIRKENYFQDCKQSMYLHLCSVDFNEVSSEVFAKTFSLIPSLSYFDDDYSIPSSHWASLSQTNDCQINEIRIWIPQSKNFEHYMKINTKMMQFILRSKYALKQLLNYIAINQNIQFDRKIKVFIVKVYKCNWDYYEEIPLFGGKTIEEYRNDYCSFDLQLDNIREPFHDDKKHIKWLCCEIYATERSNTCVESFSDNDDSFVEELEVEQNKLIVINNMVIKDDGTENQDENNCCFFSKCCCCFKF